MSIYRPGPQQPWMNRVLRHPAPVRVQTVEIPYVYDGETQRTPFKARGKPHHGGQRAASVVIPRPRDTDVTLPRRLNVSPIPQGSNQIKGDEPFYYGDGYYGDIWYGE